VTYTYHPDVIARLAEHGLAPTTTTDPSFARDALSDLYRYEIRRLRQSLLRGEVPKAEYLPQVIALRRKYWLLSVPIAFWAQSAE
jgi:hypothetical protein